ncbi:hypothetical protein GCM10010365_72780 [Streptomyces poonensis]|uniref:Uncharacterized protein n=1 Tax=Streptomyces poonensis TaxID=68255 RepID=A0A918QCG0_9ACTN|nr:hypothetical protein GCM10010365_72780 [Streptomyces poonensis]
MILRGFVTYSAGGGGVLVSADDGGVDMDQPLDVAGRVRPGLHLLQGPGEDSVEGVAAMGAPPRERSRAWGRVWTVFHGP